MQRQIEIASVIALIIAVITGIVALTRYVTRLQFSLKEEQSLASVRATEQKYVDLQAKYDSLFDEIKRSQTISTPALYKKLEIDDALNYIAKNMRSTAASIYIPLIEQPPAVIKYLVFLSILPQNAQSQALRRKPIPLASFAGRCFTSGQPLLVANTKFRPEDSAASDQISGFSTESMINLPLKYGDQTIGVLQLLNKENVYQYDEKDMALAQNQVGSLAAQVKEFLQLPESVKLLDITLEQEH